MTATPTPSTEHAATLPAAGGPEHGAEDAPLRKRDRAAAFALEAAKVLGAMATRLVSRTAGWGATGALIGGLFVVAWAIAGVLPTPLWGKLLWIALAGAAAVGGFGYVGWMRGMGRAALYVGVERGMVAMIAHALLDRMSALARRSTRVAGALDSTAERLENLPLQQWEQRLTEVTEAYLGSPGELQAMGRLERLALGSFRGFLVRRIQRYLLAIVRKQLQADGSGGGVSVERVREVAVGKCEEMVEEYVDGMLFTLVLGAAGASLLVFGLPFALTAWLGW